MKLINSQDVFEIICEHSNLVVFITDKKGNIVFANKNLEKVTGYRIEEVIGKNPRIFSAKVLPKEFYENLWNTLLNGENWEGVFINRKKDGTIYYEKATLSPIKNNKGEIDYFIALKYEITGREDIIDSTAKHLAHLIPFGIAVTDHENKIVFINKGFEKIFNTNRELILNKPLDSLLRIYKDEKPVNLKEHLTKTENINIPEAIIFYNTRTIFANITAIKITKSSSHIGTVLIIKDITEKKEIDSKKKRLKEIEQLSVFLMGFAHDFNNLLAITQMQLQSAEIYIDKDKEKAKEKLKNISNKLSEISKLISSFFETATSEPVYSIANINKLVKSIIRELSEKYPAISFELKEQDSFNLQIDKEKIKYTIYHIVKNAIEAQKEKGKIEISIEKAELPEILSLRLPKTEYIKIKIKDKGKGIKKEYLPLLFTPYFTTKERTSEKQTGLSLAICNFNVHKHGGHIKVFTEEGKGSEFIIYLPISRQNTG